DIQYVFRCIGKQNGENNSAPQYHCTMIDEVSKTTPRHLLLSDPKTWYLIDPSNEWREPARVPAITVMAASPNKQHYKQWLKEVATMFWMSVWSLEELAAIREYSAQTGFEPISEHLLFERYELFGGIPRFVFSEELMTKQYLIEQGTGVLNLPAT